MEVQVNGQARTLADGATVSQLLQELDIVPERVVVEVNLTILKRAQHAGIVLKAGDQVEIVQFVGGGSQWPVPDTIFEAMTEQVSGTGREHG